MRYDIIKINKQEKQNATKLSSHIGKERIDQCSPHAAKGERGGRINKTVFRSKHRKERATLQESVPSYSFQLHKPDNLPALWKRTQQLLTGSRRKPSPPPTSVPDVIEFVAVLDLAYPPQLLCQRTHLLFSPRS